MRVKWQKQGHPEGVIYSYDTPYDVYNVISHSAETKLYKEHFVSGADAALLFSYRTTIPVLQS